jgi:carboxyl-terminal processing protease
MPASASAAETQFPLLEEVQRLIDLHYLRDQPTPIVRDYAAIRGFLGSLNDRYTYFIEPPVAQSESDALAGTYGGVGIQVRLDTTGAFVMFPYANSPASRAGIQNGDILIAINDDNLSTDVSVDSVNQSLRGEVVDENGVNITYRSNGGSDEKQVFLPFAVIEVPSVIWSVMSDNPQIGYIQVTLFTNRTPDELGQALDELIAQNVTGLILDLRNNGGGLLQESVEVASYFLNETPILYERTATSERAIMALDVAEQVELPLIVLVNQNTASAAELVAVGLQENGRATIVGQVTYGKGSVQQIFRLSDGSSLHVTTAEWLTPNERELEGIGVMPDILVSAEAIADDEGLRIAISTLNQLFLERAGQ